MKKIAIAALLAASLGAANAAVITFDDVSSTVLPANYGGLTWSNFYELDSSSSSSYVNSGYSHGAVSGTHVAYNAFGTPASIGATSSAGFDLTDAYFTGAWYNNLNITASATFENGSTASKSFVVSTASATDEFFNWTDLSSVRFVSSGGTQQPGLGGSGTQFALDNVNTTPASTVPEADGAAMLAAGVGLLGLIARRRRAV
jgi:hypothetical protein